MICPKPLREVHEEIQQKLFAMLPEKWDRLYLYASVIDHLNNLQTGEMFFFYYPKGVLKKRPINVYEVPSKFNLDEKQYFTLADNLYAAIKNLRVKCIEENQKAWSNITISIEKLQYKVEYSYEDLQNSPFDSQARRLIWSYKYLKTPYESLSKKEREIIDGYIKIKKESITILELPLYKKEKSETINTIKNSEKNLTFVTEEKIEEMEYINTHVPKSQILNPK